MKIAIAGTNGLACCFARSLYSDGHHQFILLSRASKPYLTARGWQIIVVDYNNGENLIFSLAGIDVVISVVSGDAQLSLIDAALHAGVERFIPAEFAGSPTRRLPDDPLCQNEIAALNRLQHYATLGMAHTIFACGILYEHFGPDGMRGANIGDSCGANGEGDYLVDIRSMRSQIPHDASGSPGIICMTAAEDVGRFVVAALNLPQLPTELRMCGDRLNVSDVVRVAELMRNVEFERAIHSPETLQSSLMLARASRNKQEENRVYWLMATGAGRFDFDNLNLNAMVDIIPIPFEMWLHRVWAGRLN